MSNRRFARSSNAFSKTLDNHAHSLALNYMVYNSVRPHGSLGGADTRSDSGGGQSKVVV